MDHLKFVAKTKYHLLKDHRILCYCEFGDSQGIPFFYCHATPGSRLEGALFHSQAVKQNFRIISIDRPGMGESTFLSNRKLQDYPKDIVELANELNIDKFGMMGWSGGGVYGLACGHVIPERLLFNILLVGYTNFMEMSEAPRFLHSRLDHVFAWLSKKHPRLFKLYFELVAIGIKAVLAISYTNLIGALSRSDKKTASEPLVKQILSQSQKEAFKEGSIGVATDAMLHFSDWQFKLQQIAAPFHILNCCEGRLVPIELSEFNAAQIPIYQLHLIKGEGHLFPAKQLQDIFCIAAKQVDSQHQTEHHATRHT
jgi:pimeloyl-ACP methyl ester carboxylesterase